MPSQKLKENISETNIEEWVNKGNGKTKGIWIKIFMTYTMPFIFMYTCIIPHTITRCEHSTVNVNGSGERWFAPTDETAMSKPTGCGIANSSLQRIMLMELQTENFPGVQTCTMHTCTMPTFFFCQDTKEGEKGGRDRGDFGNSRGN